MVDSDKTAICLALLGSDKQLIGFKLDTFWSLSKGIKLDTFWSLSKGITNAWPKIHNMNRNKQVPIHLITNLSSQIGEIRNSKTYEREHEDQKLVDYLRTFGDTLYIVAYPCPDEDEKYKYPADQMPGFLKDLTEPIYLYSFKWEGFASNHKNAYIISNDIPAI